ncbi:uracil-DNA glycosylase [Ectothiorhodospiraceae bacterium BW-2]|nr:uracil-DNA glycosylase [Ectothiorhodospiraceae bacterium BW-2]
MITPLNPAPFRHLAATLEGIDRAVYDQAGADWQQPIIGHGAPAAPICFFGRDPGREEVIHQLPFIGAGGQKVRQQLYLFHHQRELPDFDASIAIGEGYFWLNTVPYKPIGNKAWSMAVKREFQPLIAELLLNRWQGERVITLGREAFFWFAIAQPKTTRDQLQSFWQQPQRFEQTTTIDFIQQQQRRRLELAPLPHPSPLNATWYRHFPTLLQQRLQRLQ